MRLRLPSDLNYPITITELLKAPSDNVALNEPLFRYDFKTTKEEDDYLGETQIVEKVYPSVFESEVEGILSDWLVRAGQTIKQPIDLADIQEPCSHEVQFHGICAMCGKDMTQLNYNKRSKDTSRAGINMVHDDVNLKISSSEASRSEQEAKKRLISSKRLSLVVDLDQTVIHATVDPTVGEWQQDPANPNHAAVADVSSFQLTDDGPGGRACWYYIKTRPGLADFLHNISKLYELHIYTMGTRAYAEQIAKIVDPDRSIFGDRILSRDESGSLTVKNLQRLFPIDTKMVVIIDDRGDVWKWNDNLVKVTPYDFFVGIGDINSSFLPQKPKMQSTLTDETEKAQLASADRETKNSEQNGDSSAIDQLVSMSGGDDPDRLKDQTEKAAQTIDNQLEERPLLQKQKALDKADEETGIPATAAGDVDHPDRQRHHLLEDHDRELHYLEQSLSQVHREFYDEYDRRVAEIESRHGSKGSANSHSASGPNAQPNLDALPDVKVVMPDIKRRVLEGVSLVFSGVVPLGVDVQNSDIAVWARSFGAKVRLDVSKSRTTHVVAARKGTAKVKQAMRHGRGKIKVVGTQWLMDSIVRWRRQEESPYLLHSEEDEVLPPDPRTGIEEDEADVLSESEEPIGDDATLTDGDTTDAEQDSRDRGTKLRLKTGRRNEILDDLADDGTEIDEKEVSPDSPFDENSPIAGAAAWDDIDAELDEFMGDSSDSDSEKSSAATGSGPQFDRAGAESPLTPTSRKRTNDSEDTVEPVKKKARDEVVEEEATSLDGRSKESGKFNDNEDDSDGFGDDLEAAWNEENEEADGENG